MIRKFLINNRPKCSNCIKTIYIEESFLSEFMDIKLYMESSAYSKSKFSEKYSIVINSDNDLIKTEIKNISYNTYSDLIQNIHGKKIEKLRRYYQYENVLIKVDEYQSIPNLKILEVNIEDNFIIPEWFGLEITNNSKYSNKSLSLIF